MKTEGSRGHTNGYNSHRFVAVPMNTIDKRLSSESGDLKTDIAGLEKKLHYLEMTHKNSRENLEQILKSGGKA